MAVGTLLLLLLLLSNTSDVKCTPVHVVGTLSPTWPNRSFPRQASSSVDHELPRTSQMTPAVKEESEDIVHDDFDKKDFPETSVDLPIKVVWKLTEGFQTPEAERKGQYLMVLIILSSVKGKDRRDTIRETWLKGYSNLSHAVLPKFIIGGHGIPESDLQSLQAEQQIHGDILLFADLEDHYDFLTKKVLYSFLWADNQISFSYLLKCDDDTFVRLDKVSEELATRTSEKSLYWGFFLGNAWIKKTGKWAEKNWFLCDHYLPYAVGGGYILSSDLIHRLAVNADGLQMYYNEDISLAVWLSPFEIERKHDTRFNTETPSRGCKNAHIISHQQSAQDMRSKYSNLREHGVQCLRETTKYSGFEYNWNVLPSQCCKRDKELP